MLTRVRVKDFQSIKDVDLALEKFSVIVGASNSGKSAFLRAIRAAAHNVKSPSVVRHGAKKAIIKLTLDDELVTLERGKAESTYFLFGESTDAVEQVYAKAGTSVPDEVRDVLRLAEVEGEDLSFAFQFDRPFLLDETGSQVAKVLGDLTGINQLFEAVREADRRRRESATEVKALTAEVDVLSNEAEEYADLEDWGELLEHCREKFDGIQAKSSKADALVAALDRAERAGQAVQQAQDVPQLPQVALNGTAGRVGRLKLLESLIAQIEDAGQARKRLKDDIADAGDQIEKLDAEYHAVLTEAGVCPVCGANQGGQK